MYIVRKKTTIHVKEDLLRPARVFAARTGRKEYEVFGEALRRHLRTGVLEKVWRREGLCQMRKRRRSWPAGNCTP